MELVTIIQIMPKLNLSGKYFKTYKKVLANNMKVYITASDKSQKVYKEKKN